ncbi:FOG: Ankyrin repeat [Streptomyces sp. Ncost-T6T-1]|uniref:ankyrin repeat domain-containing protein n=1 Tax=Streptomyces sp. Ncost-T6T-1 TaxID=1100828 RepID=UPI000804C2DB|nr:ankyrin repeat domain-containing protein [Streptomyces sp. Ncost-T6T-1]SBU98247.1 FOG: Ankyrin repeat [Streptomyces sp. Ncost-T6T-1]
MTLEASIRSGDVSAVLDLLSSGADIGLDGAEGLTPLMTASGLGRREMVEVLLAAGAPVHAIDPQMGATALHKAVQSGSADVVGLLLDHGAFIDQQSPVLGNTPLMDAVLNKHEKVVRLLLDRGARTTITNHWQQTALDLAHGDGLDAIARLIESRDETDAARIRALPLTAAAKAGDLGEVERLIAAGAPVEERMPVVGTFDDDYTPLGMASREGHVDIVRVLLDAGADPGREVGLMRGTPVHEAGYWGHADVLRALTEHAVRTEGPTVDLDAQGAYNGLTALHDAVWHGHLDAARVLMDAGSRLDLESHAGLTPRDLARLYGYDDLADILAKAGEK